MAESVARVGVVDSVGQGEPVEPAAQMVETAAQVEVVGLVSPVEAEQVLPPAAWAA